MKTHLHAGKKSEAKAGAAHARPARGGRLASARASLSGEAGTARKRREALHEPARPGDKAGRAVWEAEAARDGLHFSFGSTPIGRGGTPVGALLDLAVAGARAELPQRARLERSFGASLAGISVRRNPFSREALERLDAEAAVYQGHILLGKREPTLQTLAHEVVHTFQRAGTPARPVAEPELAAPAPEAEAEALSRRVERRAGLPATAEPLPPLGVETSLAPHQIALRRRTSRDGDATESAAEPPVAQREGFRSAAGAAERTQEPAPEGTAAPAAGREGAAGARTPADAPTVKAGELPFLEVPAPPPPGVTPEQVAAREQAVAEAQAALEGADTSSGVVDAFANAPPTLKAQAAGNLGTRLSNTMQQETQTLKQNTPPVEAHLAHEAPPPAADLQVAAPPAPTVDLEPNPPGPAPTVSLPPTPEAPRFNANDGLADRVTRAQPEQENRAEELGEALRDVRTTDPNIPTSAGPPPQVPLEGETDPQRLQNQSEEAHAQGRQALGEAQQAVLDGPGPERVQPVAVDETYPVGELPAPVAEDAPAPEGAQQYLAMDLPPEVQTAFDENTGEQMRASVGEAQGQIQQAATERDQQHQAEVQRAQTENDQLVQSADQEQRARVTEAHTQIQTERQSTLDHQREAVAGAESEAETRRERDHADIQGRAQEDRQAIDERYQQADRDAQARVSEGERDAEAQRREAEREAENQSWWDRAVNFVRDAFNALVSAINKVFAAVRSAVNAILEAVKDFAIGLINAAARFITAAIAAFGEFLKGLVQSLLGDIFPELAAALTRFIDQAVQVATEAVEAVAAGLRAAVNTLVEGLRAGINTVLNTFQGAVNAGLAILRAAVTGDWGEVARLVLEAVLRALGIDPAVVYEFIGRARDTIQLIIDDPGAFLGHLVDAVTAGIQKFADNFLTHLQAGIIGWLTGAIGGAGITLPARFDLMGVLSIIQQVLGLTWANIRQRAVRLVGERAVQAIEFVASYVETLIQGGWPALWERIQNDLATLRDMVLDQIKSFLVERIIVAAITRLATMFNPVGALLNLVLTLYNFYTFLRDQMQRIFAVAQAVINAMSDIARGVIEPAAQRVEGVLAGLLPLAIDLLARLIGLGNVGERVREIIQTVQQTIWGAIDRLIDRVLASFRGGAGAPGATGTAGGPAASDFGKPLAFEAGGEQHTLSVEVSGGDAVIMLASARGDVPGKLNAFEAQARTVARQDQRTQILGLIDTARQHHSRVNELADQIARAAPAAATPAAGAGGPQRTVRQELTQLRNELKNILDSIAAQLATAPTSDLLRRFEQFRANAPGGILLTSLSRPVFGIEVEQNGIRQQEGYHTSSQRYWLRRDYMQATQTELQGTPAPEEQASRDLLAGFNAGRVSRVGEEDTQRYAFVQAPPEVRPRILKLGENRRDPKLATVVSGAVYANAEDMVRVAGIVAFMQQMARTGAATVGDLRIERSEFDTLWANQVNADWIKDRFRDAASGMHEWIPSNMIPQVIDRTRNSINGAKIANWVGLQHDLRSDTSWVIFKPPTHARALSFGIPPATFTVLQGHSGAMYLMQGGSAVPQTEGQNVFHNELRAVFDANKPIEQICADLKRVFGEWVWNGTGTLSPGPHPLLRDGSGRMVAIGNNYSALATQQATNYSSMQSHFDDIKARYGGS